MYKKSISVILLALILLLTMAGCGDKNLVVTCFEFPELTKTAEKYGDCTYIEFPNGENMLIDAGTRSVGKYVVARLQEMGVEKLDYAVLSHPHSDHWGGYVGAAGSNEGVLDNFKIGRVLLPSTQVAQSEAGPFVEAVERLGLTIEMFSRGDTLEIGNTTIEILNPGPECSTDSDLITDVNSSSLVMLFRYKDNSLLMTGDLYAKQEGFLVEQYGDELHAQLLKVPHHGHTTSGTKEFVEAVSADMAFAEGNVGVTGPLYARYKKAGTYMYITFVDGTITFTGDGSTFSVATEIARPENGFYD